VMRAGEKGVIDYNGMYCFVSLWFYLLCYVLIRYASIVESEQRGFA
jgi:hypothetical protein